jgi:hypothetical protein
MARLIGRLLLALLVFIVAPLFLWLRSSLPHNDGEQRLEGLSAAVQITRDH